MSSPPFKSKAGSSKAQPDNDPTAELPMLETDAQAAEGEQRRSATDTWIAPPVTGARAAGAAAATGAEAHPADSTLQTLSTRLRESQGLLAAKDERLRQFEHARDEALEARAAAERRAAQLDRELAQLRAEHAFQLDEHARERALFDEQLAQGRALLSAAGARADELQRRVAELETAARQQHDDEQRHQQLLAQDRARAAGVMGDLHQQRERTLGLLESLQSAEGRRGVLQELVTDLQREGEERERELARVARALAGRDAHARELEAELAQRAARIARVEQQVSSLAAGERTRTPRGLAADHSDGDSKQQSELERLRAERAGLTAAVESARAATLASQAQAAGNEATLAQLRARIAELESSLTAELRRVGQLEDERSMARREIQDRAGTLQTAQQERSAHTASLSAAEARIKELEARAAEQQEAMSLLQSESSANLTRAREAEADLHAAEEAVHRLESQARGRNARLEELERVNARRRTLEEAGHVEAEPAPGQAPREAARPPLAAADTSAPAPASAAGAEPAPDGAARLLIRSDGGREIVHVLSRRTSIGRTPDNDLQIDAQFVSRHHAVILAGSAHTIIEDLNSTNGVLVNGRRVTRQILKDGDTVHIARLSYRFVVRKSGEKR